MDITGEYFIPTRRDQVWAALNDPDILRSCIPGCRTLVRLTPNAMQGTVEVRIGPLTATFNGTLTQSEVEAPRACRLTATGDGAAAGFATGTADVTLTESGEGTALRYTAHATVGGKLAEVGARLIDSTAKQMADQFFRAFAARVGGGAVAGIAGNGAKLRSKDRPVVRAEHAVEEAAHEVADVARDEVEKAEVAAGRGFLGGPQVWALIVLAVIIAVLLFTRR